ncbi:MAG: CRISPR-associated endoribonuclease Cas6 [Candidatus Fervidibacter sp.]|uniref:CRISPR-associated endoribonuclease Cas6 n=1 Tax=Candidatus Fervidibacter sp. TaxID=3100871 RepID=UPI00404B2164
MTVPWDYRTALTKAIYEVLSEFDPDYSNWLQEQGFRLGKRACRLFVYSDLIPTHKTISQYGLADVRWMTWQIGSPDQRFIQTFIKGLERRKLSLELFGTTVEVLDLVQMKPLGLGSGLVFHTISPIAVSVGDPNRSKHPIYLHPDQPEFVEGLKRNLIAKWEAFHQKAWNETEFGIRVWNPKSKLVRVFDTNVRAWHLHLQMWGSDELIRFTYDAGLGIKNSQGFGMIEPGV